MLINLDSKIFKLLEVKSGGPFGAITVLHLHTDSSTLILSDTATPMEGLAGTWGSEEWPPVRRILADPRTCEVSKAPPIEFSRRLRPCALGGYACLRITNGGIDWLLSVGELPEFKGSRELIEAAKLMPGSVLDLAGMRQNSREAFRTLDNMLNPIITPLVLTCG